MIPGADALLTALREALGPEHGPVLIGIDGRLGAGKSGLASWLAWQLEVPVVHLDLYQVVDEGELPRWRYQDLARVLQAPAGPVIVEGVCLCQALHAVDRDPDILVWLENEGGPEHGPEEPTEEYEQEFNSVGNADHILTWREPDYS